MLSNYSKYIICIIWMMSVMPVMQATCQVIKEDKKIIVTNDIVYKKSTRFVNDTATLRLDVYRTAAADSTKRAAIIFVHGGGFWEGDKRSDIYVEMARTFAMHAYTAVSVNYTLKGKDQVFTQGVLDTCIEDVMAAVKWMKVNADRLGIDTSMILICGDSAGGGIVINASYNPLYRENFIGCIDLWGGLPGKQGWEAPIYTGDLAKQTPATCIIHGTADRVVPYETSSRLSAELTAANVFHSLHPLENADHYPVQLANRFIPIMIAFADKVIKGKGR